MEKIYSQRRPLPNNNKKITMNQRASGEVDRPRSKSVFVSGTDDDLAMTIAIELEQFFYTQGINTGKNATWLSKAGHAAVDRSMVRRAYSQHPDRFRDGEGRQLTLAEFGRNMVKYFRRNASWQYCSNADEVISLFYDPVTLDDCAKGLWRVYKDRRTKRGIQ
jgi:hypothetical protein